MTAHISTFMSECRGPSSSVSLSPSVPRTEILTSEIDELEHQLARASKEKELVEAQGREDRDSLVHAIQALEVALHEKQIECDEVRDQVDGVGTELADSRRKCHSLQATLNELSLQYAKLECLPVTKGLTSWQAFFLLVRHYRQSALTSAISGWTRNHTVYCQTSRYAAVLRKANDAADASHAGQLRAQAAAFKLAKKHRDAYLLNRCLSGLMRNAHKKTRRNSQNPTNIDHLQRLDRVMMMRTQKRFVQQWFRARRESLASASVSTDFTSDKSSQYQQRLAGVRAIREKANQLLSPTSQIA